LIVPHHGGKAGKYVYDYTPGISCQRAIISVGKNNYGHQVKRYVQSLSLDFLVEKTSKARSDILINL